VENCPTPELRPHAEVRWRQRPLFNVPPSWLSGFSYISRRFQPTRNGTAKTVNFFFFC
jgi:hypothetical protein